MGYTWLQREGSSVVHRFVGLGLEGGTRGGGGGGMAG